MALNANSDATVAVQITEADIDWVLRRVDQSEGMAGRILQAEMNRMRNEDAARLQKSRNESQQTILARAYLEGLVEISTDQQKALADILARRGMYVNSAAAAFFKMLDESPPTGDMLVGVPVPTLTTGDLRIVSNAMGEAYVDSVIKVLLKFPGAVPMNGASIEMLKEAYGQERTREEIAADPLCFDWCRELSQEFTLEMRRPVMLSTGQVTLQWLINVNWGQQWNPPGLGEHNYPIVFPVGMRTDKVGYPDDYLILDAWITLRPTIARPEKYDLDMVAGPHGNIPRARHEAKYRKSFFYRLRTHLRAQRDLTSGPLLPY